MNEKLTFEEAKQKVADKHRRRDWTHLTWDSDRGGIDEDAAYAEAAELMAQSWANHHTRTALDWVHHWLNTPPIDFSRDTVNHLIKNQPLPFPEEK